jgi:hypothetical protein
MRIKRLTIIAPLILAFMIVLIPVHTSAATNYNDVIDNGIFDNSNSMNAAQINTFLNSFPSSCISTNNGFSAPDPTGYSPSGGYTFGGNVSAGQVIYDAAQAYGLNPQVLLATLQKEQSLITGSAGCYANVPNPANAVNGSCGSKASMCTSACPYSGGCINIAVGYGCPYYCNAADEGFSNQIIRAAWVFTYDRHRAEGLNNWYVNKPGWNNSADLTYCYSGYDAAGGPYYLCPDQAGHTNDAHVSHSGQYVFSGSVVTVANGATAALYDYTPYLHGQDLFTSAFNMWFGSTNIVKQIGNPGSVSWGPGRIDTFSEGSDGQLWQKWYDNRYGGWQSWSPLGVTTATSPTVTSWVSGRLDIFYVGNDGSLDHYWYQDTVGGWQSVESLGQPAAGVSIVGAPGAVSWGSSRIDVFARGSDNALWQKTYDGTNGGWQPWVQVGGDINSAPTVSTYASGRLDVFATGPAGDLEHFWYTDSAWHNAESLGTPPSNVTLTYTPGAVSWGSSRIDVFARGSDGVMWQKWFDATGWHPWVRFYGVINATPSASSWAPQRLDVFSTGPAGDLQHLWFNGSWGNWESLGQPVSG